MGCVSSCFRAHDDEDDHDNPEPPAVTLLTLPQQLYTVLFQRGQLHVASSSVQRTNLPGSVVEDSSIPDSYHPPPRPLSFDDPRCSRSHCQREGFVLSGDKVSSHLYQEFDPLREMNTEQVRTRYKLNGSDRGSGGQSKTCLSHSSLKFPSKEVNSGVMYIFSSSEDEDVCPTCLEEYTSENPRIIMQCSHHFHLGCIYDWMERSEACPVCGKVMVFDETA